MNVSLCESLLKNMLDLILVITESSMQILSEEQGDMSVSLKREVHIFWLWIAQIK